MKKYIFLIGSSCIILMVISFMSQNKLKPKSININSEDSYIIYKDYIYNDEEKDDDVREFKFTKNKCIIKGYWKENPDKPDYYSEHEVDEQIYLEVMDVLINEIHFFTMEQPGIGGGLQTNLEIKNGDQLRNMDTQESEVWQEIKRLINTIGPPV